MEINLNTNEDMIVTIDDVCKFRIWGERDGEGTMKIRHDVIVEEND